MTFVETLIIVIVAIGLEGSLVFGGIKFFLRKRGKAAQMQRFKYVVGLYRDNYPEQLACLKYAKDEESAEECAKKLLGERCGHKVVVCMMNVITGAMVEILYVRENPPSEFYE